MHYPFPGSAKAIAHSYLNGSRIKKQSITRATHSRESSKQIMAAYNASHKHLNIDRLGGAGVITAAASWPAQGSQEQRGSQRRTLSSPEVQRGTCHRRDHLWDKAHSILTWIRLSYYSKCHFALKNIHCTHFSNNIYHFLPRLTLPIAP